jgi:hypothetical protein
MRDIMRHLCEMLLLFSFLCASPSAAQEGATETIVMPKPVSISRFIPTGERRTLNFVASLFPDCASRGPIVARMMKAPSHGTLSFVDADSYPNYVATNPLSSCNGKRSSGLNIVYKAEDGYRGDDLAEVFLMFPDGTAAEWHYLIMVK